MSTENLSFGTSLIADRLWEMRSQRSSGFDASPGNLPAMPTMAIGITGSSVRSPMLIGQMVGYQMQRGTNGATPSVENGKSSNG